jgi:hypothetical protein
MILDHHRISIDVSVTLTATETIAVAAEEATLTEAHPPSESLAGAEAAVSLTETTEYVVELLVQATEAVQPAAEAAALTTQGPGAESLAGAEAAVTLSESESHNVEPANSPPTADLTTTKSGSTVEADASGSTDPDGDTLEFRFDFDDGNGFRAWDTSAVAINTYNSSGFYVITVEVRDGNGGQDSTTNTVSI